MKCALMRLNSTKKSVHVALEPNDLTSVRSLGQELSHVFGYLRWLSAFSVAVCVVIV